MNKGYLYVLFVVLAWASTPVVTKILIKSLSALQIVFYMFLIAVITLFLILFFQNKLELLKKYSSKDFLALAALGFLGVFLYNLLYTLGFRYTPAAEANTLNYLWPVFIVLFSFPILKERFTLKKLTAIVMGFAGAYLVITQGNFLKPIFTNLAGDIIMIGGAAAWALFSVFGKKVKYESYSSMFYYLLFGLFFLTILMFYTSSFVLVSIKELVALLYLGIATKALAFTFWFVSIKELGTTRAASFAYLSPFIALFLINIFIKEAIYWHYVAALALIVGGILLQTKK